MLYIQKLRNINLFEQKFSEDIENNIIRTISSYSVDNWRDILDDKYVVENLLPKTDVTCIAIIADNLVKSLEKSEQYELPAHVLNSSVILNSVNASVLKKINKIMSKQKRKHDEELAPKLLSSKIFSTLPDDLFLTESDYQATISKVKDFFDEENGVKRKHFEMKISEDKICRLLDIAKSFPVVFSHSDVQKVFLIYLFSLHKDFSDDFSKENFEKLRIKIEDLIFGKYNYFIQSYF